MNNTFIVTQQPVRIARNATGLAHGRLARSSREHVPRRLQLGTQVLSARRLAAVAIVLFALAANPTKDLYAVAHRQIRTALAIDWDEYAADTKERLRTSMSQRYRDHRDEFYRHSTYNQSRPRLTFSGFEGRREELSADQLAARLSGVFEGTYGIDLSNLQSCEVGVIIFRKHVGMWATLAGYLASRGDARQVPELTPLDLVRSSSAHPVRPTRRLSSLIPMR